MLAIILYLVVSYVNVTQLLKRIKHLPAISKWNMTKNFVRTALILIAGSSGLILIIWNALPNEDLDAIIVTGIIICFLIMNYFTTEVLQRMVFLWSVTYIVAAFSVGVAICGILALFPPTTGIRNMDCLAIFFNPYLVLLPFFLSYAFPEYDHPRR